jgi:hypothetical protein
MKLKQVFITTLTAACIGATLTACAGGSTSGPTQTANYGQVESIIKQNFNSIAVSPLPEIPLNSVFAAGIITLVGGNYVTFPPLDQPDYGKANALNTKNDFNFDPMVKLGDVTKAAQLVSAYVVNYLTPGQNANSDPSQVVRTASGLIILPPQSVPVKGVVVYFHPTTFSKNSVPSCLGAPAAGMPSMSSNQPGYCTSAPTSYVGGGLFGVLSSIYAANGYAVVAPDYIGMGADGKNYHPYVVYPENNVEAAFNMFPALRQILAENGTPTTTQLQLMLTGFSEGGGYALKASQMAQTTKQEWLNKYGLNLVVAAPQEGAYSLVDQMNFAFDNNRDGLFNCTDNTNCGQQDMMESAGSSTMKPEIARQNQWFVVSAQNAALAKPALTGYVLGSAMYYSFHNIAGAYDMVMYPKFWNNIPVPGTSQALNLYQLFTDPFLSESQVRSYATNVVGLNGYNMPFNYSANYFNSDSSSTQINLGPSIYGRNNSAFGFITRGAPGLEQFQSLLTNGSTYNWQTSSPINFIHLAYDSFVTVVNSKQAYTCMRDGKSFSSESGMIASQASCTTAASGDLLIHETVIKNFQQTNNENQNTPWDTVNNTVNTTASSHYWTTHAAGTPPTLSDVLPMDHGDMTVIGNIAAYCIFENALQGKFSNNTKCQ